MARKGYYHGDEFIEYKRGNLAGQYGPSSKKYAKKTVYNSGTYNRSKKSHPPDDNISKKDKNSFLTSDNQYSKRLESNKCVFCGKKYNRNIYMLCPYCYVKCSRCGRKYNTKLNSACPNCGSSIKSNISNNSAKKNEKSIYDHNSKIKFDNSNWIKCPNCNRQYNTNRFNACPHCEESKYPKKPTAVNKSKGPYLANWPYSGNKPYTNFDDPTFKPNWSCAPKSSNSTSNDSWFSELCLLGIIMVFLTIVILSLM